jgi:hypothetical protein
MSGGNYIPHPGNPGALINHDMEGHHAFLVASAKRMETERKLDEINTIKQDVDSLKQDITDIKNLLLKVLESK